jgi:hypothetical protein
MLTNQALHRSVFLFFLRTLDGDNESADEESIDASLTVTNGNNATSLNMLDDYSSSPVDSVGRKLQGASAPTMRVPPQFRYNMLRVNEQSAVVRTLCRSFFFFRFLLLPVLL